MRRLILFLAATLFFTACANKSMTRYEALAPVFEHNGYDATISEIKKQQDDLYGEKTEFLYYFDLGVLYHYNGNYAESAKNFDKADKIYDDLYTRSVTNEAAAIVTNDNIRPYRARPFEILVLHEMQIMNYLAQKNVDGALVEVNRALKAMTELYQKDNDKTNDNGFLRYLTAIVYEMAGEPDEAAIAYYKTVKAYDENILNLPKEAREFVIENLKRSDREDDIHLVKEYLGRLWDILRKGIKSPPVQSAASAMFCQADRHHLEQPALVLSLEVRVGLDLVVNYDPVCLCRNAVTADRCMSPVIQLPDLYDIHTCSYRYADILLSDPIAREDFQIAFCRPSAVAAHSRNDERFGSPFLQLITDCPHYDRIVRDTPAADCHGNVLPLHKSRIILLG